MRAAVLWVRGLALLGGASLGIGFLVQEPGPTGSSPLSHRHRPTLPTRGRVVDAKTGAPVPGALVATDAGPGWTTRVCWRGDEVAGLRADGRGEFAVPAGYGYRALIAVVPGRGSSAW